MAIRVVRHIGAREVESTEALPLVIIPYGAGERLRNLRIDAYAASEAENTVGEAPEVNWAVIDVPWSVLLTHATLGGAGGTADLDTAAEWDTMFRNLLLEYGTDGNEYYGGDPDQAGGADVVPEPGLSGESGDDEPAITRSIGPSGVMRLFAREVLMRPLLAEGSGAVRWFDEFNVAIKGRALRESGGCVLAGVVRYETPAETNFSAEWSADMSKGLRALIGGDMQRVQEYIQNDTGAVGDRLRTMLFGGDNYVEANTLKELAVKAYMKVWCAVETPYRMGVV